VTTGKAARRARWILGSMTGAALIVGAVRLRARHNSAEADAPADVGLAVLCRVAQLDLGQTSRRPDLSDAWPASIERRALSLLVSNQHVALPVDQGELH
jgi:hypothetical protein